jgi:hypothetical protein
MNNVGLVKRLPIFRPPPPPQKKFYTLRLVKISEIKYAKSNCDSMPQNKIRFQVLLE